VVSATVLYLETGGQASMEKERDTLRDLARERIISVPTAMTPMNQNLNL
jgi:hypothetical protein